MRHSEAFSGGFLAVDSTGVFWSDEQLVETSFASGTNSTFSVMADVADFALGTADVYFTATGRCYPASECYQGVCCTGAIMTAPLAGGTPTTLVSNVSASAIALDSENIYWTGLTGAAVMAAGSGSGPGGASSPGSAELWSVPLRGGSAKALTSWSGGGSPQSIMVQGDYVYWVGDGIMKVSTRGGTPTVAVSAANGATAFAFDSTSVYWINPGPQCPLGGCNDTVRKASLDGSGVTTLASGITAPAAVAVDSANVYWLTRGLNGPTGSVMKLAK